MPISGKKLCKLVEKHGWVLSRINGSHHIYTKDGQKVRLTIPVHGNRDLNKGLLKALLKAAGIESSEG